METPVLNEGDKLFSNKKSQTIEKNIVENFEKIGQQIKTPDELKKITEIRDTLKKSISDEVPEKKDIVSGQNKKEIIVVGGKSIVVEYVSKKTIYPAFGYAGGSNVVIREDLSPRVKKFVRAHEVYHCIDEASWGGWIGREIRANIVPGLKDPVGLVETIWATISDIDRIKLYLKRIKNGY